MLQFVIGLVAVAIMVAAYLFPVLYLALTPIILVILLGVLPSMRQYQRLSKQKKQVFEFFNFLTVSSTTLTFISEFLYLVTPSYFMTTDIVWGMHVVFYGLLIMAMLIIEYFTVE